MGKYHYEQSFEKAIEQGVSKEEYARESSKNCIMAWIANELAEQNRLKRIELEQTFAEQCGMTAKLTKDVLEDKA